MRGPRYPQTDMEEVADAMDFIGRWVNGLPILRRMAPCNVCGAMVEPGEPCSMRGYPDDLHERWPEIRRRQEQRLLHKPERFEPQGHGGGLLVSAGTWDDSRRRRG